MADQVDELMLRTLNKVSETGNATTGDILVLKYCKSEKARKSKTPAYKQALTGAGEIVKFVQTFLGGV